MTYIQFFSFLEGFLICDSYGIELPIFCVDHIEIALNSTLDRRLSFAECCLKL